MSNCYRQYFDCYELLSKAAIFAIHYYINGIFCNFVANNSTN